MPRLHLPPDELETPEPLFLFRSQAGGNFSHGASSGEADPAIGHVLCPLPLFHAGMRTLETCMFAGRCTSSQFLAQDFPTFSRLSTLCHVNLGQLKSSHVEWIWQLTGLTNITSLDLYGTAGLGGVFTLAISPVSFCVFVV